MTRRIVPLLAALALAGCSTKNPFANEGLPTISTAHVVAVTLPESLMAGTKTPLLVHWWKEYCSEQVYKFDARQDRPRHWTVTLYAVHIPDRGCLPSHNSGAVPDTFEVVVPAAGVDSYTVVGAIGSIDFEVKAGIGALNPGHRVELHGQAVVGVRYTYLDWAEGTVDTAMTDSSGVGRLAPPPCGHSFAPIDVEIAKDVSGAGTLRFDPGTMLCGRALRTIVLYGPATSSASRPAM
jgi:hypothetical protein